MIRMINPEEIISLAAPLFVDVRSESEFAEDHIPGAVNLPVFNDQERIRVGTVYHQSSPEEARRIGLQIVAPKLPSLVDAIGQMAPGRQIVLYCWRGGTRSNSLAVVLDLMNIQVYRLQGGYKQFRRLVYDYFSTGNFPFQAAVLHGLTGTGKTEILKNMMADQVGVLDLEGLANHRGSVFGGVGLPAQPSQKYFESLLWYEMEKQSQHHFLVMECESKRIGRLVLPTTLVQAMQAGRHLLVYDSLENRIQRLQGEYDVVRQKEELLATLMKLKGRLGSGKIQELAAYLQNEAYFPLLKQLLEDYYDPLYDYPDQSSDSFEKSFNAADPQKAAGEVCDYLAKFVSR